MSGHGAGLIEFKLFDKLKQRNLFRWTAAYLGTAWLIIHVATVLGETIGPIHHLMPWVIGVLAAGLPVVLIGAWFHERKSSSLGIMHRIELGGSIRNVSPRKLDGIILTLGALIVLALVANRWIFHRPNDESMLILLAFMVVVMLMDRFIGSPAAMGATKHAGITAAGKEPRLAVLPFADMSPGKDQEHFCEGTAEEIINALSSVRGLRVASRSASFHFKDRAVDRREIGRLLDVGAFLEGSVRKAGDRVRITAQLISVGDGFHLWSETFDRQLEDIFAIQEEIARSVVNAMRVTLFASDTARLQWRGTENLAAYDFYLRGRQLLNKEKEAERRAAMELFRQAIRLDPAFAHAHAGLADVLTQLLRQRQNVGEATPADAVAASQRAIELAPELPDAYIASGNSLQLAQRFAEAEVAFERAIALDPRHFHAHYWFGRYWASRGQHALAAKHYELAFEIKPDDYRPITLALQEYQALKDAAKEQSTLRRSWQAIERHLAIDPDDSYATDHAAGVLMLLGRREEANRLLERALALRPDDYGTLYTAACTASLGGEYDRALDFLDRAVGTGRGHREWILNDNDLAPLREYPRFKEIVGRLG